MPKGIDDTKPKLVKEKNEGKEDTATQLRAITNAVSTLPAIITKEESSKKESVTENILLKTAPDKRQRTVLHFITGLESAGGAEMFLSRVLPMLDEPQVKHVVCSILPPGEIGDRLVEAGIEMRTLNQRSKYDPRVVYRFRKLLKDLQPDMHISYLFHADIFARIFAPLFSDVKLVSFIRNKHQGWVYGMAEKLTLSRIDCLLTNSPAVMHFYEKTYSLPDCREIIPNGVPLPDEVDNTDRDDGSFVVVTVARLHPQKSLDTLIQAAAQLKDDIPGLEVLFVGEGQEKEELQQLAVDVGVKDNVYFLGRRNDVQEILATSDVFVLPSIKEGMSNALLEAMAMARPCVVSDIPENTALIKAGENGLTFSFGDAHDLADQLHKLHTEPDLCVEYGQDARQTVVDSYSLVSAKENLEKFIKEEV
jgi:glycosyltransferase involved in cell wall biosynthesis